MSHDDHRPTCEATAGHAVRRGSDDVASLGALQERVKVDRPDLHPEVPFGELSTAHEELRVADEEQGVQRDALRAADGAVAIGRPGPCVLLVHGAPPTSSRAADGSP